MPHYVLVIIFSVLLLPGLIGVVIPIIPSVPWMFVVALIFGIIERFEHLHWWELLTLGLLAVISLIIDNAFGLIGAKKTGTSKWGLLGGFIGGLIGLFFFPPYGAILGMIIGVIILEMIYNKNNQQALKSASGTVLGSLTGIAFNLLLGLIFIILFILFALK